MRGIELLEMMEFIDPEYIEAADALPEKTVITSFRPWMKWAVAAILIVVIGVGTPVALNMMGVFRNENFVSPSGGSGNSGVITSYGSSEERSEEVSSAETGENGTLESSVESTAMINSSLDQHGNISSASGGEENVTDTTMPAWEDKFILNEVNFVKVNISDVTYQINGENVTFTYGYSSFVKMNADMDLNGKQSHYVIDHYIGSNGGTISIIEGSYDLIKYASNISSNESVGDEISESEAVEIAKRIAVNTSVILRGVDENASASIKAVDEKYYVVLSVPEGRIDIYIDKTGALLYFVAIKDVSQQLSPEMIAIARERMKAKLVELNNNPNEKYVLDAERFIRLGDSIYAIFSVNYYPHNDSNVHSVYQFYCAI
ncbi:MAG: hypothetical protein J5756_03885 [Clostridia bacterium]|nr:hypothetical protein [Clostridia bacterium]